MIRTLSGRLWPRLAVLVLLTASVSCASGARLTQFQDFASAGTSYAQAMDALLEKSGEILIDTNSEKLLQSRALAPVNRSQFAEQDQAMRANLTQIRLLQRQLQVLADYFTALSNLATSKAPDAFAAEIDQTVPGLVGLYQSLHRTTVSQTQEQGAEQVAKGVGELVVRGVQVRALNRELQARKQTIAQVLLLHEKLLQALQAQVTADLQFTTHRQYEKEVIAPFLDPNALTSPQDQQDWMTKRRQMLSQPVIVQELDSAINAAQALRQAWIKLLSRRLTAADLLAVEGEIQPILAGLDTLADKGSGDGGTGGNPP